jgi:hypothetical protein
VGCAAGVHMHERVSGCVAQVFLEYQVFPRTALNVACILMYRSGGNVSNQLCLLRKGMWLEGRPWLESRPSLPSSKPCVGFAAYEPGIGY